MVEGPRHVDELEADGHGDDLVHRDVPQGGLEPVLLVPPLKVHNDTDLDTCPPQRELVMCVLIACHKERKNYTNKNKQVCTHRLLGRSDGQQGTGAKPGMRA